MTRRIRLVLTLTLTAALLPACVYGRSGRCRGTDVDNCFSLRAPAQKIAAIAQAHGLTLVDQLHPRMPGVVLVAGPSSAAPETTALRVRSDPRVAAFEEVVLSTIEEAAPGSLVDGAGAVLESLSSTGEYAGPESLHFSTAVWDGYMSQPAARLVRLPETHELPYREARGLGTVALIDTGVDPDHPALRGALVAGYDFLLDAEGVASEWDAFDPATGASLRDHLEAAADQSFASILEGEAETATMGRSTETIVDQSFASILEGTPVPAAFGHGTMVAGLVRLVAPAARIMPLRVFDGDGNASSFDILRAIYYAVDHGANVINMSFTTDSFSVELSQAVKYAESRGVVCVSSAGNSASAGLSWPAAFGQVLGVAATDLSDHLSRFSSYGPNVAVLAAPGEELVTLYPGGNYAVAWGTSFSAALVAGAAALLNADDAGGLFVDYDAAERALATSAVKITVNQDAGKGRLDVYGAFGYGLVGY